MIGYFAGGGAILLELFLSVLVILLLFRYLVLVCIRGLVGVKYLVYEAETGSEPESISLVTTLSQASELIFMMTTLSRAS